MTPVPESEPRSVAPLVLDRVAVRATDVSKTYFCQGPAAAEEAGQARSGRRFFFHPCRRNGRHRRSLRRGQVHAGSLSHGRERVDRGRIDVLGQPLESLSHPHRIMQLVPQECSESLNPRVTVEDALREANPGLDRSRFEELGIPPAWASRRTRELSTGQRARVSIARALAAVESGFLVLDESLSGLDASTANAVLRRIALAQREKGLACLLIAHEESIVAASATRVLHLDQGRLVA